MLNYFIWSIFILASLFCVLYVALIAGHCYGWIKTKTFLISKKENIPVAIIIAARNEEQNIAKCLDALLAQDYDKTQLEIFVVDDSSSDKTKEIILSYCRIHKHIQLMELSQYGLSGKKQAITTAISKTQAELIITTDADCTMGRSWLSTMVSFYKTKNAKMVVGPVVFSEENSAFEKMQTLEFMALMGSTAGSLYFNKAILCNGANLAYSRDAFNELKGFEGNHSSASGDDVLLMYKFNERFPKKIGFLKSTDAIVFTSAKSSLSDFIDQRKRWASKGFGHLNRETKTASLIVYLFCFFLVLMGGITVFASIKSGICQPFLQICLILIGIKCIIDFLLLFLAASFFKRKKYLYLFLPEQLIYILYVVLIGLLGNFGKYSWKGRTY